MRVDYLWRTNIVIMAVATVFLGACNTPSSDNSATNDYTPTTPPGFPKPRQAADNPLSEAKVELGRHLFYDVRMSIGGNVSCATCHIQAKAFSDGLVTAQGSTGEVLARNSMTLTNVTYNPVYNWANPLLTELHTQAMVPMFGETPVELGWSGNENEILDRLRNEPIYPALFTAAFPDAPDPFTALNVAKAVAAFVATLISGNSAYDKATYQGQPEALSAAARRGLQLFNSERLECFHCHGGFNFSEAVDHAGSRANRIGYFNNGLYNLDGNGAYPLGNRGLWEFTFNDEDMGKFRPPTLRNIELTAPYMHDGSVATLEEVVDIYARGGRNIASGPHAGDGAASPVKSGFVAGFVLTAQERADVVAFLQSLTDWEFVCDPRLSDPFGNHPPHPRCQP